MQETFHQIANLFLGAIPTSLLFLVLVLAYQVLVQRPLSRTLKERRDRTDGAVEEAHKAIALADAKADEYALKLRQARADIYKIREHRVQQWTAERDTALDTARKVASQKISQAKAEIESDADKARQEIHTSAAELANRVVKVVLPATAGGAH